MLHFRTRIYRGKTCEQRFWSKVNKTPGQGPQGECWIWTAYCNKDGYGQLGFGSLVTSAHRVSYELVHGPIGNTYTDCILHRCDNPPCVNPDHLFIGTRIDNVADMNSKGRAAGAPGLQNGRVILTPEQVAEIRSSNATNVALGIKYGVAPTTISAARRGRNWQPKSLEGLQDGSKL